MEHSDSESDDSNPETHESRMIPPGMHTGGAAAPTRHVSNAPSTDNNHNGLTGENQSNRNAEKDDWGDWDDWVIIK